MQVRVGIGTGLAVVGDLIGQGTAREQGAGERRGRDGSGEDGVPEREGGGVLRVKAVFSPSLGGLIFPPRGKPTGDGRFRAKGLWDARGRQQGWWCPDSPG